MLDERVKYEKSMDYYEYSLCERSSSEFVPEALNILFEVVFVLDFGGVDIARNSEVIQLIDSQLGKVVLGCVV